MLSLYRTEIQYSHSSIVKDLGVCIKVVKDEELGHSDLLGTNGIIFVLPPGVTDDLSAVSFYFCKIQADNGFS